MNQLPFYAALRRKFSRLAGALEHELMPRRCVFCGALAKSGEGSICTGCAGDLPRLHNACVRCGMPRDAASLAPCIECQIAPPPFYRLSAALAYEFPIDAAIRAFKFHRQLFYVPAFTELLLVTQEILPVDIDAVLPVPLHRWRKLKRGFNQAMELALPVAEARGIPILRNIQRIRPTPSQSGLDARARQKNIKDAFVLRGQVRARHVLLVDDVVTTGTTCKQLATLLRKKGVPQVSVLALARAVGRA